MNKKIMLIGGPACGREVAVPYDIKRLEIPAERSPVAFEAKATAPAKLAYHRYKQQLSDGVAVKLESGHFAFEYEGCS